MISNQDSEIIEVLMDELSAQNASDMMASLRRRVENTIEEVYGDLTRHIDTMQFVPKEEREKLKKFIVNIDLIQGYSYTTLNKRNGCVSILELEDSRTKPKSRANYNDIEKAAGIVINGGKVSVSSTDRYDILEKAVKDGLESAVRNDMKRLEYLEEVVGGHSEDFLEDVYRMVKYQKRPDDLKGRCWKIICSDDYIAEMEKQVFGSKALDYFKNCDMMYDAVIQKGLEAFSKMQDNKVNQSSEDTDKISKNELMMQSVLKTSNFPTVVSNLNNPVLLLPLFTLPTPLHPLNFLYDEEQGIYYADVPAWQWFGGYNDFYDRVFESTCDCKAQNFLFQQEYGEDKIRFWRLEIWKGNYPGTYGISAVGAEIGIYCVDLTRQEAEKMKEKNIKPEELHYFSAGPDDFLNMSFVISSDQGELFYRPSTDHWWLTGFKPNIFITADELLMRGSFTFKNKEMFIAFVDSLNARETIYASRGQLESFSSKVYVDPDFKITGIDGLTVYFEWQ